MSAVSFFASAPEATLVCTTAILQSDFMTGHFSQPAADGKTALFALDIFFQ
jgi:hypothetical protein